MVDKGYSLQGYRSILEAALRSGYRFVPFSARAPHEPRSIYLRHDVDYSPEMALQLARVNADTGVLGTFCLLLRSQVYNLLSPWSKRAVREIHGLGQRVAFHVSLSLNADRLEDLERQIAGDFAFLVQEYPFLQALFSWHNPTRGILDQTLERVELGGLINAYAARFTREVRYVSDSNMRHSAEELRGMLTAKGHPALQLLLHPVNWVVGGADVLELFSRTWPYVIREREHEIRLNGRYSEMMPEGASTALWNELSTRWLESARATAARRRTPEDDHPRIGSTHGAAP